MENTHAENSLGQPLVIVGKSGTLGSAFGRICEKRNIRHVLLGHDELDITDFPKTCDLIKRLNPYAVINTAGYVDIDKAESDFSTCYRTNYVGAALLAEACRSQNVKYLMFSTDMVFDGGKNEPYTESDTVKPINVYGESKASAESRVLAVNPDAIIIRSGSFFSPWSAKDFVAHTLAALRENTSVPVANDVFVSPTFVPDLIVECLNLLFDNESGIFHLANEGTVTWAEFAKMIADISGYRMNNINELPLIKMKRKAQQPKFSALKSEKGIRLPSLEDALNRYFEELDETLVIDRIAV